MNCTKKSFSVVLAFAGIVAIPGHAQDGAGKPKPNIAVSGCLKREGYGGVAVTDAKIDGLGNAAATAAPGAGKPVPQNPPRWVLDHASSVGQHVGEKVQVVGFSTWVEETKGGTQEANSDGPPMAPHIDMQSFKTLADSCS